MATAPLWLAWWGAVGNNGIGVSGINQVPTCRSLIAESHYNCTSQLQAVRNQQVWGMDCALLEAAPRIITLHGHACCSLQCTERICKGWCAWV